eukprot:5591921-Ditylum_brightwellii.AAC.1
MGASSAGRQKWKDQTTSGVGKGAAPWLVCKWRVCWGKKYTVYSIHWYGRCIEDSDPSLDEPLYESKDTKSSRVIGQCPMT